MRIIIVFLALAVIISACGGRVDKESQSFVQRETTAKTDAPVKPAPAPNFQIISAGEFGYNTHRVAGAVLVINNGTRSLRLQNFQTEARPDLHVFIIYKYDNDEIDLGPLTQYTGNVSFPLTHQETITQVSIRSGSALLATAELS